MFFLATGFVVFSVFSRFSAPKFVKSRFLDTQEELEALLWVCFTSIIVLLIPISKDKFTFNFSVDINPNINWVP